MELNRSTPAVVPTPLDRLPDVVCAETIGCTPGIVDLWLFYYDEHGLTELFDLYDRLLTPGERERRDRFRFDSDRRLFVATRALVRTVLSSYSDVAPTDWQFASHERGKPYVAAPALAARLAFNLSNTDGMVACVVSCAHDLVGVDGEALDHRAEIVGLADHYFSPIEIRALRTLDPSQQRARFFAYWTLKESYIKARGLGLALQLDRFSFLLDGRSDIRLAIAAELDDDAKCWRFALVDASPRHLVAVGVNTGGAPLSLRQRVAVPLRDIPLRTQAGTGSSGTSSHSTAASWKSVTRTAT